MALSRDDLVIATAEQRLSARATALRSDWQNVLTSCRNSLTSTAMIGTVAVTGAMLGARSRPLAKQVDCKCVKGSPSLVRVLLLATITPLLQNVIARGLGNLSNHATAPKVNASPTNVDAATSADVAS